MSSDPTTETAEAVATMTEVEHDAVRVAADARRMLAGQDPDQPLRAQLQAEGVSLYPLVALSALVVVDEFQGAALTILAPEIADTLGLSIGMISLLIGLKTLVIAVASLFMASWVQRHPRRAAVALGSALVWTLFTFGTGFVISAWGLALVLLVDGASTGSTRAVHAPLLMDSYPRTARMRALATYRGADSLGNVLAPLAVAALIFTFDLTWRGVFIALAIISAAGTAVALRLRDPGFGRFDEDVVADAIGGPGAADEIVGDDEVTLGFFEILKRVLLIPTVRQLLIVFAVLGAFLVPLLAILSFFLEEQFNLDPVQRAFVFSGAFGSSIVALLLFGRRFERIFADDPRRMMDITAGIMFGAMVSLILGTLVPVLWLALPLLALGVAMTILMLPPLNLAVLSVVPSRMRPHVSALLQIYLAGIGGVAGSVFLGSLEARVGISGALIAMLVPATIAALLMRRTRTTIVGDMEALIASQVEEQEYRALRATPGGLPMLACRGVDVSYGQLQVLFDIDFTVDDGEMVALLGTNGAGKSTLLRAISGLTLPSNGSVRYAGADITYLAAERRVQLGISQVPGGKAVFGPLSVAENLRLYGYALRRDRKDVDDAIERSFHAFPKLRERRDQMAQTLSGGEQQMLALSKALILQPRLLLIDELSLGLAPIIVGQLIEMVREINATGTAVVLVEQSVNVALELVEHAYFMEKGQMRFDGRARDLLGREDLLRAVFLEGAEAATSPADGSAS